MVNFYKKCFFLIFTCFFNLIFAEYILFDINSKNFLPEKKEFFQAIEIVQKWQFPNFLSEKEVLKDLDNQALTDLCENEQLFIEKKLEEQHINLKLFFIPTSLYEFFILMNKNISNELERHHKYHEDGDVFEQFDDYGLSLFGVFYKIVNNFKYNEHFYFSKEFYYKINSYILKNLNRVDFSIKALTHTSINKAAKIVRLLKSKKDLHINRITRKILLKLKGQMNFLLDIFNIELQAHRRGYYTLLRGTQGFNGSLDDLYLESESCAYGLCGYGFSYGNSLFAGIFNDKGASAFTYIFDDKYLEKENDLSKIGYALWLDKLEYVKTAIKANFEYFFYISPMCCLNGLTACGELFHSRYLEIPDNLTLETKNILKNDFKVFLSHCACIIVNKSDITDLELLNFSDLEEFCKLNIPYKVKVASRKRVK